LIFDFFILNLEVRKIKIAVINETSSVDRNGDIISALEGRII